jgi:hypothetical protein
VGTALSFFAGNPDASRADPVADDRSVSAADVLDMLAF